MVDENPESGPQKSRAKGVVHLLGFAALIMGFMMLLAPLMDRLPMVQPMVQFIEDRDIDASALFYTEIEEFSDAANYMNNTMGYSPQDNFKPENQ
jgi:hypothetical protein